MTSTAIETTRGELEARVLNEGYGPGAWHGPDLKAALADVTPALAFWRPGRDRHNIAEIALHHAYCTRAVRAQLSGRDVEPFILSGEDWFQIDNDTTLPWPAVQAAVESELQRLREIVANVDARAGTSTLTAAERFNLVLGITCHAVYHAGQVQLIKRLAGSELAV